MVEFYRIPAFLLKKKPADILCQGNRLIISMCIVSINQEDHTQTARVVIILYVLIMPGQINAFVLQACNFWPLVINC